MDEETSDRAWDAVVVGGGVAGLTAATFLARADEATLVVDAGGSILRRNAHLENFPGFPDGVDPRRLLSLQTEQAATAGATHATGRVTDVTAVEDGFRVTVAGGDPEDGTSDAGDPNDETDDGNTRDVGDSDATDATDGDAGDEPNDTTVLTTNRIVAATKNAVGYLDGVGVDLREHGKTFVETDERGRTGVPGLYAAGRLAGKPHQAAVCAGHSAEVAVTVLEDSDEPFYHDWVTPAGYFTDRGREVPPGCEEIDAAERERRGETARTATRETFAEPHPEPQETHPSLEPRGDET